MTILQGLRVAIVDDSKTIARAAKIFLEGPKAEPTGAVIETYDDGFELIQKMQDFRPDVVLLDVVMPRSNGFNICKLIKKHQELSSVRVVMMTSKDGLFDRAHGANAGADAYVTKPFVREQLLLAVKPTLQLQTQ